MNWQRFICILLVCAASIEASWKWSNPRPHGNNIMGMAYTNGLIWQVGDRGRVYTSTDLDFWTPRASGTDKSLRAITFFKDLTIITGAEGTIVYGENSKSLQAISLGTGDWLEAVTASPEIAIAVGDNGAIYSSPDAINWTRQEDFTPWLRGVAYGADRFITVGDEGFWAWSTNGIDWTTGPAITEEHLNSIAYQQNTFWVLGDNGTLFTNTSRYAWVKVELGITNNLYTATANTNEIVLAGDGAIMLGDVAAQTWKLQTNNVPVWPFFSSVWDERLFLVGGRSGMQVEGFRTNETSEISWFAEPQPTRSWLWSVTRAPEFYAAVGANGTVVTSENGVNWFREATPPALQSEIFTGVSGNTNVLVAVGTSGAMMYSPNVIDTVTETNDQGEVIIKTGSVFGIIWKEITPRLATGTLQGIAANDSVFVAAGEGGTILSSPNGSNWVVNVSPTTQTLSSITTYPGGFVAVGDRGTVLRSENGLVWLPENSGVTNWIYSVRHLNGKLFAVGEEGVILTSSDAQSWERLESPSSQWLNDIAFESGKFFIVGDNGTLLTSLNGANWQVEPMITNRSIYSVTGNSGQVVAVGTEGTIVRKQLVPFDTPVQIIAFERVDDINTFLFDGQPGQAFELQGTSTFPPVWDLEAELEIPNEDGLLIFQYRDPPDVRFFRTVSH